jgi:large subunit ribosomal protein L30
VARKDKKLKVTLVKSRFHRKPSHAATLVGLGLRKRHQSVTLVDSPETRGMIASVNYMVEVEEVQ